MAYQLRMESPANRLSQLKIAGLELMGESVLFVRRVTTCLGVGSVRVIAKRKQWRAVWAQGDHRTFVLGDATLTKAGTAW